MNQNEQSTPRAALDRYQRLVIVAYEHEIAWMVAGRPVIGAGYDALLQARAERDRAGHDLASLIHSVPPQLLPPCGYCGEPAELDGAGLCSSCAERLAAEDAERAWQEQLDYASTRGLS